MWNTINMVLRNRLGPVESSLAGKIQITSAWMQLCNETMEDEQCEHSVDPKLLTSNTTVYSLLMFLGKQRMRCSSLQHPGNAGGWDRLYGPHSFDSVYYHRRPLHAGGSPKYIVVHSNQVQSCDPFPQLRSPYLTMVNDG